MLFRYPGNNFSVALIFQMLSSSFWAFFCWMGALRFFKVAQVKIIFYWSRRYHSNCWHSPYEDLLFWMKRVNRVMRLSRTFTRYETQRRKALSHSWSCSLQLEAIDTRPIRWSMRADITVRIISTSGLFEQIGNRLKFSVLDTLEYLTFQRFSSWLLQLGGLHVV